MDFTREPIIETVITPREGCKLVVRSSKNASQEEYFVDAIQVVSFGHSFFFRSLERPKAFLVPASDYEVLEVREARMVLKNVGIDRTIKIGGGRDAQMRGSGQREPLEKEESSQPQEEFVSTDEAQTDSSGDTKSTAEPRLEKKRDRRRQYRRRRGREEGNVEGAAPEDIASAENKEAIPNIELPEPRKFVGEENLAQPITTASILTSLLPPPPTLISETIARYKNNALFRGAFYSKEETKTAGEEGIAPVIPLEQPEYGSFEVSEEEEERIYQQRKQHAESNKEGEQDKNEKDQSQSNIEGSAQPDFLETPPEAKEEDTSLLQPKPSKEEEIKNGNHQ